MQVHYKSFHKEGVEIGGQPATKMDLHVVTCKLSVLIEKLHGAWPEWVQHDFHKKWQKRQQDCCIRNLQKNEICTVADFAEKFQFKVWVELKVMKVPYAVLWLCWYY
jgi:hypothetical protein